MSVVASFVYSENGIPLTRVDRVEPGRDGRAKNSYHIAPCHEADSQRSPA